MPTNDERREIAARLQDMANERGRHDRALFFASLIDALSMEGRASVGEILNRLAELIEPEERTCRPSNKCGFPTCECGEVFKDFNLPNYCPNCGAKVVNE